MNTRSESHKQLTNNLGNKAYRDAFVESHIRAGLSFQIRAMRDARGWTQKTLAERANTKQEAISRLENPDYGRFTLETLKRLASAFDVALVVRFAPFSELIDRVSSLRPSDLNVPDFVHDEALKDWKGTAANVYSMFSFTGAKTIPNAKLSAAASTTSNTIPVRLSAHG